MVSTGMARGLIRPGAGGPVFAAAAGDLVVAPILEALGRDTFFHLAMQEERMGKPAPRTAEIRPTRLTLARQAAAMEDEAVGGLLRGVRCSIEAAALVHMQRATLEPAAVGAEDEVHIALDEAVLKVLPAQHQRAVAHRDDPLGDQARQRIPGDLGHRGPAEERILAGDHAHVAPHAPVTRRINRHSLPGHGRRQRRCGW